MRVPAFPAGLVPSLNRPGGNVTGAQLDFRLSVEPPPLFRSSLPLVATPWVEPTSVDVSSSAVIES